jgi:hypothetical protein
MNLEFDLASKLNSTQIDKHIIPPAVKGSAEHRGIEDSLAQTH